MTDDAQSRHLRPVEAERKGAKFAALDHDVARVLGPQRGAAVLYGFLASTWFEFADPQKLAERKKKITPGDWVEVDYRQLMAISGTNAKASIIRWLRILAEDVHECPWGRCGDEHPLIVVQRQGQSRPNRYRKWRCREDVLVVRRRVRSQKLSEAARRRVDSGQRLNGITESPPAPIAVDPERPDSQLALLTSPGEALTSEVSSEDFKGVSLEDNLKSNHKTSESLAAELQEVLPRNNQKSYPETSLHEKTLNTDSVGSISERAAAKERAAIEETDEVDAVACEIVDAILFLAQRVEPSYRDERAWSVARRLASAVLEVVGGKPAAARAALLRAIGDRRLARASNPVGLLIRGIVGDDKGTDRYLLAISSGTMLGASGAFVPGAVPATNRETSTDLSPGLHSGLLDALRAGRTLSDAWLRERGISSRALAVARAVVEAEMNDSATPLADKLAKDDEADYRARLDRILSELELPAILRDRRALDHPMLLGMCRARLEAQLRREEGTMAERKPRDGADRKAHQEKR